jgi:hypothetical protein
MRPSPQGAPAAVWDSDSGSPAFPKHWAEQLGKTTEVSSDTSDSNTRLARPRHFGPSMIARLCAGATCRQNRFAERLSTTAQSFHGYAAQGTTNLRHTLAKASSQAEWKLLSSSAGHVPMGPAFAKIATAHPGPPPPRNKVWPKASKARRAGLDSTVQNSATPPAAAPPCE